MIDEIYPMPLFPMLIVDDLEVSSNFYQTALGFKHVFTMPGPGGHSSLMHLRWAKYADLLIARPRNGKELTEPKGVGVSLNFNLFDHFNSDIDIFAKHARQHGATVIGPIDQSWNVREVTIVDPDGYKLIFTVPLNANLAFEKVIGQASSGKSNE